MNEQPRDPDWADAPGPLNDHEQPTRRIEPPDLDALPLRRIDMPEDYEQPTRRVEPPDLDALRRHDAEDDGLPTRRVEPPDVDMAAEPTAPPAGMDVSPLLPRPEDFRPRTYTELPWIGASSESLTTPTPPVRERAARKRRGKTARERRESGLYLPWWTLPILLGVVAFFVTLLLLGLNLFGGQTAPGGETPVVVVITSVPTTRPTEQATLRPSPTALQPGAALEVATGESAPGAATAFVPQGLGGITGEPPTATPAPGAIHIGVTVQVANVEGLPLNIRESAGRSATPRFLATEGTRFTVIGGPQEADGLVWWQVQDPQNASRQGWAAADYLAVVSE